jgi:hypothetical protein
MFTADPATEPFALFTGAFLVIAAFGILRARARSDRMLAEIAASPGLAHGIGAVTAFVGLALLVWGPRGDSLPAILVGLVGLWWTIEGVIMLAFPERLPTGARAARLYWYSNVIALIVGACLILSTFL